MAAQKQEIVKYKEVEGFRDHRDYFKFINEKYSDVSVAALQKNFEMLRETMRELIDNSCPYHSNKFRVKIKDLDDKYVKGKNDQLYFKDLEYSEYYEVLVEQYYEGMKLSEKQQLTPDEETQIAIIKDKFIQESRRLRRMIITDLSISGIIPQASEKKIRPTAENMEGVGL